MVVARQDRHSSDWYVGAATNELARQYDLVTDFLESGADYRVELYSDGENAHWRDNPMDFRISQMNIQAGDTIQLDMKAGGGAALRFVKVIK